MRIMMHIGSADVAGTLLDSGTARAFAERLPVTVRMSGMGVDLCGRLPFALPYRSELVHRGWSNGDINYNPTGGWLAVQVDDEENSRRYGDQLTIGRVEGPLEPLRALSGPYDVRIELA